MTAIAARFFGLAIAAAALAAHGQGIRLPDGPGASLVYAKCQTCHDLQYVVEAKGLLPAQWRAVIASMHDYGLTATDDENAQLLKYLTAYLGPNAPPAPAAPAGNQVAPADGRTVYAQNCAPCHGPEGHGQPGNFPPLAANPDLAIDDAFPVLVVLHGLSGAIDVDGNAYDATMPPFDHLSNADIAAVINFVRTAWGDPRAKAAAPLTADSVASRRAQSMTPAEVRAYRARSKR
ncbi:MAG TPA: cytochrome c [Casimicrobiaceae bacterium]|nr:cytochrome c [Casimicrobiaceae bacterium]